MEARRLVHSHAYLSLSLEQYFLRGESSACSGARHDSSVTCLLHKKATRGHGCTASMHLNIESLQLRERGHRTETPSSDDSPSSL